MTGVLSLSKCVVKSVIGIRIYRRESWNRLRRHSGIDREVVRRQDREDKELQLVRKVARITIDILLEKKKSVLVGRVQYSY